MKTPTMNKLNSLIADAGLGGAPVLMSGETETKAVITGIVVVLIKELAIKLIDKLFKKRSNEKVN